MENRQTAEVVDKLNYLGVFLDDLPPLKKNVTPATYLKGGIFFCRPKWITNWNNMILQAGTYVM